MKNSNLLKVAILIVLGVIFYFAYSILQQSNITVVKAEFDENYEYIYPADCFITFQNRKYLAREVYKYKNGRLIEYWFPAAEGFAIEKFGITKIADNKRQGNLKTVWTNHGTKIVMFDSLEYKIGQQKGDTLISKINSKEVILFIDNK